MSKLRLKSNSDHPEFKDAARFISVLSGKGGVGKSVLSFNLAERMSAAGYRVLLVDGDFASGNLHILANATARRGVAEYASEMLTLADAVTSLGTNLDLLAAVASNPEKSLESVDTIARFVNRLHQDSTAYDLVLIDHASGVTGGAAVLAHGSDLNLLVLVPELTSIADAYGLYKYLHQTGDHLDAGLLLNRVQDRDEADFVYTRFVAIAEQFLGVVPELVGFVLEEEAFRKAVGSQSSLAAIAPQNNVTKAIEDLSHQLTARLTDRRAEQSRAINKTPALADIRG